MKEIGNFIKQNANSCLNFVKSFRKKLDSGLSDPGDLVELSNGKPKEKEWTVLVYEEGKDRLAFSSNLAINKMEAVGSDDNVNIVTQATIKPTLNERLLPEMERVNTRRYYITQGSDPKKIESPVVEDLGKKVPLNTETLSDFLSWGVGKFPAKHYMVVIKKHGIGFAKSGTKVPLSARDLSKALESMKQKTGKKVDVVAFDACSMGQVEVAHEIKDQAKVMTASQENIFAVEYPYEKILGGLKQKAGELEAKDVGKLVVDAHRADVPAGMQTALDLEKMQGIGMATKDFVDAVIKEGIPPEVIYTNIMKGRPTESDEPRSFLYNFRDEKTFLDNIINEKQIPDGTAKQKAVELQKRLSEAVIDHQIGNGKKMMKRAKGLNLFMPWKEPSENLKKAYGDLSFEKASSWMKLIEYMFSAAEVREEKPDIKTQATPGLSVGKMIGKKVIFNYKKYVSPYLNTACKHTPSCSQYGREAVEKFGLFQGGKMAFMRLLSCNHEAEKRYDPVPDVPKNGEKVRCNLDHGAPPPEALDKNLAEVYLNPPANSGKSRIRRFAEDSLTGMAKFTGKLVGGAVGAFIAAPVGIFMGAKIGTKIGNNSINNMNREMLETYNVDSVKQFVKVEHAVGDPADKMRKLFLKVTGSDKAANFLGGITGAISGTLMGALGGAAVGWSWGSRFSGLFAQNYLKDKFGELPKDPATEKILKHYYGDQ